MSRQGRVIESCDRFINLIHRPSCRAGTLDSKTRILQRNLTIRIQLVSNDRRKPTKNLANYLTPDNFKRQSNLSRRKASLRNGIGCQGWARYLRELAGILGGIDWQRAHFVRHLVMFPGDFV
jgi:hypothetical protein